MKPKITDFVNCDHDHGCDHLLFSMSRITVIEATINQ